MRLSQGLTQEELGELLFVEGKRISAYETNYNDLSGPLIVNISRVLHTTPNYLLLGSVDEEKDELTEQIMSIVSGFVNEDIKKTALEQLGALKKLDMKI